MRIRQIVAGLGAWLVTGAALAAPAVDIAFPAPENFADAGRGSDLDATLDQLRRGFILAARRHLKDTDRLTVEVLDVDRAGRLAPTRGFAREVREMRDIDAPRIRLRYELQRGERRTSGESQLTDPAYLSGPKGCRSAEPLCHELRMIDAWMSALARSVD